jgi:serine/threonine protein kinase
LATLADADPQPAPNKQNNEAKGENDLGARAGLKRALAWAAEGAFGPVWGATGLSFRWPGGKDAAAGKAIPPAEQRSSLYVCIVMEKYETDLRMRISRVRRAKQTLPEALVLKWIAQLVSVLRFCHGRGIVHRDVKSQNIFLDSNDNIKLGDFGLAKWLGGQRRNNARFKQMTLTDAGTEVFKSPEALVGGRRDGRLADIWALGLVILEAVTLKFTWERPGSVGARVLAKEAGVIDALIDAIPVEYSQSLRLLVRKCLTADPKQRPTADELMGTRIIRPFLRPFSTAATSTGVNTGSASAVKSSAKKGYTLGYLRDSRNGSTQSLADTAHKSGSAITHRLRKGDDKKSVADSDSDSKNSTGKSAHSSASSRTKLSSTDSDNGYPGPSGYSDGHEESAGGWRRPRVKGRLSFS